MTVRIRHSVSCLLATLAALAALLIPGYQLSFPSKSSIKTPMPQSVDILVVDRKNQFHF